MTLNSTVETSLQEGKKRFIEAWGVMSSCWGISKTMAQIYALLYSSNAPMDTDEIMQALDVSRGNANMNLHKLIEWGIIYKVDKLEKDSRKDLFIAEKDVWMLTVRIIMERNEKEVKPVISHLSEIGETISREAALTQRSLTAEELEFKQNLQQMHEFMLLFNSLTEKMIPLLKQKNLKQIDTLLKFLGDGKKYSKAN